MVLRVSEYDSLSFLASETKKISLESKSTAQNNVHRPPFHVADDRHGIYGNGSTSRKRKRKWRDDQTDELFFIID